MRLTTLLLITLLLAACSAASASTGELSVDGAWARPAPQSVNSAFFMTITNDSAETITLSGNASDKCVRMLGPLTAELRKRRQAIAKHCNALAPTEFSLELLEELLEELVAFDALKL